MLSFDISMMKDNSRFTDSGISMDYSWEQQYSPNGSKRQRCSWAVPDKPREVDSFLGFKSVFSFL
uniref:Uncharacterized protein n=1 Tax=Rhizophora mucronata TaxID=61149 RepID=A0A2P2J823_RHIMU